MEKETLKQIKEKLLAEKVRLEKELGVFTEQNPHDKADYDAKFPNMGDGVDENAAEVAAYSDRLSLEHSLENTLVDVNKALARIEKGEYGKCKYCGEEISADRLLARPVSSSCIDCKNKLQSQV